MITDNEEELFYGRKAIHRRLQSDFLAVPNTIKGWQKRNLNKYKTDETKRVKIKELLGMERTEVKSKKKSDYLNFLTHEVPEDVLKEDVSVPRDTTSPLRFPQEPNSLPGIIIRKRKEQAPTGFTLFSSARPVGVTAVNVIAIQQFQSTEVSTLKKAKLR